MLNFVIKMAQLESYFYPSAGPLSICRDARHFLVNGFTDFWFIYPDCPCNTRKNEPYYYGYKKIVS